MARGLEFQIKKEEGLHYPTNRADGYRLEISDLGFVVEELYYPYSENKGADQLHGLCFRICKKPVFSRRGSYYVRDSFP